MPLAIALPIAIGSSPLGSVTVSPLFPTAPEPLAQSHWLFGGAVASLTSRKGGQVITPLVAPTYSSGYLTTAAADGAGLETPFADGETWSAAVIHQYSASRRVIFGAVDSGDARKGIMLFRSSADPMKLAVGVGSGLATVNVTKPAAIDVGDWMMTTIVAAGTTLRVYHSDGSTAYVTTQADRQYAAAPAKLCVGNGYYTSESYTAAVAVSELMYATTAWSATDVAAIYARAAARMTARGLTLG